MTKKLETPTPLMELHRNQIVRKKFGPFYFGLSLAAIDLAIKAKKLPTPFAVLEGGRAMAWTGGQLIDFFEERQQAIRPPTPLADLGVDAAEIDPINGRKDYLAMYGIDAFFVDSFYDFDPDEARDPQGLWTASGSGGTVAFHGTTSEVASKIIREGIKVVRQHSFDDKDLYVGSRAGLRGAIS